MKNYEEVQELKCEANSAKNRLMDIMSELFELGAIREAKSLETIIIKLEVWQNK